MSCASSDLTYTHVSPGKVDWRTCDCFLQTRAMLHCYHAMKSATKRRLVTIICSFLAMRSYLAQCAGRKEYET